MSRPLRCILAGILFVTLGIGCGSSTGKNLYKDKDKPKPAAPDK